MQDIQLTEDLSVYANTVDVDLNGHIISGDHSIKLMTATQDATSILIISDSRPEATHSDSSLPNGGVITSQLLLTREAEDENYDNKAILYGNGGTVTKAVQFDTGAATISYIGDTMTTFMSGVTGCGTGICGGLYYGELTSTVESREFSVSSGSKILTFNNGNSLFAQQIVKDGKSPSVPNGGYLLPASPEDELNFIGWYKNGDGHMFDPSSSLTENTTVTATWSRDVGTLESLQAAVNSGYSVRLTADITLTNNLQVVKDSSYAVIDLNGYVIDGNKYLVLNGSTSTTELIITDSAPRRTHSNSSYPTGGYLNGRVQMANCNNNGESKKFANFFANGGYIKEVYCNSSAGVVYSTSSTPSVIEKVITSGGIQIKAGTFYYSNVSNYQDPDPSAPRKITFKDGDVTFAVIGTYDTKISEPARFPTKSGGYAFVGWYNGDEKYDFSKEVSGSITLTAQYVEDTDAPVIGGVDDDKLYCTTQLITIIEPNLNTVTVNGVAVTLTNGTFYLDMSDGKDKKIVATDTAGHSSEITVNYGHTMGTWQDEFPTSCTSAGTKAHKDCTSCGKHFDITDSEITDLTIAILEHTFDDWADEVPATCTDAGIKAHKDCLVCKNHYDKSGVKIDDLTIAALGHTFDDWVDEITVTCSENGTRGHKDCAVCQKHFDDSGVEITNITVNALGHTFSDWTAEIQATCTENGIKGHESCLTCNKHFNGNDIEIADLNIEALGHTFGDWIDEIPVTCTENGIKGHWDCSVCQKHFDSDGNEITDLTVTTSGHIFGDWNSEVLATSESNGVKAHKTCTLCGKHFDIDGNEISDINIEKLPAPEQTDSSEQTNAPDSSEPSETEHSSCKSSVTASGLVSLTAAIAALAVASKKKRRA